MVYTFPMSTIPLPMSSNMCLLYSSALIYVEIKHESNASKYFFNKPMKIE